MVAVAEPIDIDPRYNSQMQKAYIAWVYKWGYAAEGPRKYPNLNAWKRTKIRWISLLFVTLPGEHDPTPILAPNP